MKIRMLFIGMVVGAVLMISGQILAKEVKSVIGYPVQTTFPVELNGIKMEINAIVVDDSSYLPVRRMAEVVGKEVDFDEERRVVILRDDNQVISNDNWLSSDINIDPTSLNRVEDVENLIRRIDADRFFLKTSNPVPEDQIKALDSKKAAAEARLAELKKTENN